MASGNILVVDDEQGMCDFMEIMLKREGYDVTTNTSPKVVIKQLKSSPEEDEPLYDLIITDLMMPEMSGLELLTQVRKTNPQLDFIVMTAFGSVDTAIEAMKKGAYDYITKPFKVDEVKLAVKKCLSQSQLYRENLELKKRLGSQDSLDTFIGESRVVVELKKMIKRIAPTDSTVLVTGESGTGKEIIANSIHQLSRRGDKPLVSINCAALPETLLESELFGHRKGSFTGAFNDKEGLLKSADGGSFFLDEVGNTSPAIQMKLLRVLEAKEFIPLGDTRPVKVDLRLIAASNADLEAEVKAGRFREDLFWRLNVFVVNAPPLRERKEDLPILLNHFLQRSCAKQNLPLKRVGPEALDLLASYDWPGNVRELENLVERMVLFSRGEVIGPEEIPKRIEGGGKALQEQRRLEVTPTLQTMEEAYIYYVLQKTGWSKSESARILGIDLSTLYRKIDRYSLTVEASVERSQQSE
ncbi:MAG: sigma-54-dependent Fis family transcriptional regulator [Candidatus Zixiibacteriota bacterium]|nr:MAG: sigma-54-dependent Fis family transcriptional regulator [candidate division Zixibacteria bacterium]